MTNKPPILNRVQDISGLNPTLALELLLRVIGQQSCREDLGISTGEDEMAEEGATAVGWGVGED